MPSYTEPREISGGRARETLSTGSPKPDVVERIGGKGVLRVPDLRAHRLRG